MSSRGLKNRRQQLSRETGVVIFSDGKTQLAGLVNADIARHSRNPATLLYTPRECPRPKATVMTIEEVQRLFSALAVRERLIAALAIIGGMRPGEIFGLRWARLDSEYADVRERVYRGDVDTPKTHRSVRFAALSDGLVTAAAQGSLRPPPCRKSV